MVPIFSETFIVLLFFLNKGIIMVPNFFDTFINFYFIIIIFLNKDIFIMAAIFSKIFLNFFFF